MRDQAADVQRSRGSALRRSGGARLTLGAFVLVLVALRFLLGFREGVEVEAVLARLLAIVGALGVAGWCAVTALVDVRMNPWDVGRVRVGPLYRAADLVTGIFSGRALPDVYGGPAGLAGTLARLFHSNVMFLTPAYRRAFSRAVWDLGALGFVGPPLALAGFLVGTSSVWFVVLALVGGTVGRILFAVASEPARPSVAPLISPLHLRTAGNPVNFFHEVEQQLANRFASGGIGTTIHHEPPSVETSAGRTREFQFELAVETPPQICWASSRAGMPLEVAGVGLVSGAVAVGINAGLESSFAPFLIDVAVAFFFGLLGLRFLADARFLSRIIRYSSTLLWVTGRGTYVAQVAGIAGGISKTTVQHQITSDTRLKLRAASLISEGVLEQQQARWVVDGADEGAIRPAAHALCQTLEAWRDIIDVPVVDYANEKLGDAVNFHIGVKQAELQIKQRVKASVPTLPRSAVAPTLPSTASPSRRGKFCPECGEGVLPAAKFCEHCRHRLRPS